MAYYNFLVSLGPIGAGMTDVGMYWTWKMFDSVNCNLFRILNNFLKLASWHSIFSHNGYHILRMESDKFDVNLGKV